MKKGFILGVVFVLSLAATFNAVATRRADLAHVDCVSVCKMDDGGISYRPTLTVPTETTLPDAGLKVTNENLSNGACELTNVTARTNVLNFMNNQGQSCGLQVNDLGN